MSTKSPLDFNGSVNPGEYSAKQEHQKGENHILAKTCNWHKRQKMQVDLIGPYYTGPPNKQGYTTVLDSGVFD